MYERLRSRFRFSSDIANGQQAAGLGVTIFAMSFLQRLSVFTQIRVPVVFSITPSTLKLRKTSDRPKPPLSSSSSRAPHFLRICTASDSDRKPSGDLDCDARDLLMDSVAFGGGRAPMNRARYSRLAGARS
jgi:hypothetical protein